MAPKTNSNIFQQMAVDQGITLEKMANVEKKLDLIGGKIDKEYATKEWVNLEYGPTKKIVNYILMLFGTAVVVALASLVIRK